ncbi:MAG: aminopeptidase [Solirubrobacterales bacterium]|nr:aminopeptidase [Solirubrobacterales bacterium]
MALGEGGAERISLVVVVEELDRAVRAVIRDCMEVEPAEEVLIVCNPVSEEIGELLRIVAQGDGAEGTLAVISERDSHAAEPSEPVAAAMLAADVVLAPTIQSISHTEARRAATEAGVRIASMPGVTEEMLARVMGADMRRLRRQGAAVCAPLSAGSEARITCAHGSDLRLGLEGRTAIADAGALRRRGAFGNLPCGEGFIAPVEGTAEGTLIVDGSIAGVGRVETPVSLTIRDGHLTEATGADGALLIELLTKHGLEGTNVAELGIGTNEEAILSGNILEDEKILGTAHVAFGASAAIGGTVQVPVHLDCVILKPTVEIDDKVIVREGELLV